MNLPLNIENRQANLVCLLDSRFVFCITSETGACCLLNVNGMSSLLVPVSKYGHCDLVEFVCGLNIQLDSFVDALKHLLLHHIHELESLLSKLAIVQLMHDLCELQSMMVMLNMLR